MYSSLEKSAHVQSKPYMIKEGGVHAFKCLYILSYSLHSPSHTHPHTYLQMTVAAGDSDQLQWDGGYHANEEPDIPVRKHQHHWYGELPQWCLGMHDVTRDNDVLVLCPDPTHTMYNTWWCHHDVTRDSDVLALCPDPTHTMYNTWCHHDVTRDNDMLVLCPDPTHTMYNTWSWCH